MKSEVLANTDLAFLGEISILIFFTVFAFALFWIYRPGSKQVYRERSHMPLDDGDAPRLEVNHVQSH